METLLFVTVSAMSFPLALICARLTLIMLFRAMQLNAR
jgi:hypothetical protein